jgi:hypothetical protein
MKNLRRLVEIGDLACGADDGVGRCRPLGADLEESKVQNNRDRSNRHHRKN